MADGFAVAVVGATGVVGAEMLDVLEERSFPVSNLRVFASERSRGRAIAWRRGLHNVEMLEPGCFEGTDLVLMEVESPIAREWAPRAVTDGATVIDNSSAWRMDDDVPLVVSEVNPSAVDEHRGIIANPNCTTMALMPALAPLDRAARVKRVVLSTYQAVSGAGRAGIEALIVENSQHGSDLEKLRRSDQLDVRPARDAFDRPIAYNVIAACDSFVNDGHDETKEERKLVDESRKILDRPTLEVAATCVRVPVVSGHSISVNAEFRNDMTAEIAAEILSSAPGVMLHALRKDYPTPLETAGSDPVHVGRLRTDETRDNTIDFFVVGDNLRKGAALNAVQIAEVLVERGRVEPRKR